jgi:hypothetical protein
MICFASLKFVHRELWLNINEKGLERSEKYRKYEDESQRQWPSWHGSKI